MPTRAAAPTTTTTISSRHSRKSIGLVTAAALLLATIYLSLFVIQYHLFHTTMYLGGDSSSQHHHQHHVKRNDDIRSTDGTTFGGGGSLSLLMEQVQKVPRLIPDDGSIDQVTEKARCQRFGYPFVYNPQRTERRRIFAGGLLADDSWHALGANALETYAVYHSVTFIESNVTQSGKPRPMRFTSGTRDFKILQSGIYGPSTIVHVDNYFVHDREGDEHVPRMIREHMMRQEILHRWKKLGMRQDDIGLIFDVDEIPSREFLRATQMCDLVGGTWDTGNNQTCRAPLLRFAVPMFEGSPKCIHKGAAGADPFKRFNSPSMVIGRCIEGIGDDEMHPTVPRTFRAKNGQRYGGRRKGYGERNDYSKIPNGGGHNNGYYPLYNAADFRRMDSGPYGGVGFHLHNFFVNSNSLRFKHLTYGHEHKHAYSVPLGAMNADLNLLVKCVHNISDVGNRKERLDNGLALLVAKKEYDLPAAFKINGYIDARHQEVLKLLLEDEKVYGRADFFDGNHLYNETTMLSHPGRQHREKKKG